MKHAYCIIAHNEPVLLQKLIEAIDDDRNDIYLMIDKKAVLSNFSNIKTFHSKLIYVPQVDIRWGDISQIAAEIMLFEIASKHEVYQYYHLLSGIDLPIKSQDYIHDFMNINYGKEFVGYSQGEYNEQDLKRRTNYFYILTEYYRSPFIVKKICRIIRSSFVCFQKLLNYKRTYNIELKKGANWVSITHDFCVYLLQRKNYIMDTFKYTLAPDEMFVQTILWQSPYYKNVYNPKDEFQSCLREIDWKRGNPYLWGSNLENKEADLEILKKSEKLFARKFSSNDMDFINKVLKLSQNKH